VPWWQFFPVRPGQQVNEDKKMPGNTFGALLKITTWGESHGKGLGVVIDGCPPNIPLDERMIQSMLNRRRPGKSTASTTRKEPDQAMIMSGVFNNVTTGTPIMIMVTNKDANSKAYEPYADLFRPGHGDITYMAKYGIRDWRGGGRASARETVGRVAAGAVAKAILKRKNIKIIAYTVKLGGIQAKKRLLDVIDKNMFYCPDMEAAEKMEERVLQVKKMGDSIGGIVEILAKGVPPGLGDPVFDKIDADLAKALMSIGAVKGVEIGSGFEAADKLGSENNDPITPQGFSSNNAGGILAGISNGDDIVIRVAVKPIPSILIEQKTIDTSRKPATISTRGRHDISAIPRINVVCEAMVSLVLADHLLRQRAIQSVGHF
jgi:chorismate synthase